MDFFVVPSLSFELLYAFIIVHIDRRLIVWSNVTRHPTAEWVAQQITEAFPWNEAPRHLIRDRDSIFGVVVKKRLRAMGIRDKPTAPRSPWQNAYAERLIGSIRRECIDLCIPKILSVLNHRQEWLGLDHDRPVPFSAGPVDGAVQAHVAAQGGELLPAAPVHTEN